MGNWDERYRNPDLNWDPEPLLVEVVDRLPAGRALDLASGPGRHALYLAARGWQVTAVDSSQVAIDLLRRRNPAVDARCADLEKGDFEIAPAAYDLICDFFYLQRDLFPRIYAGLRLGGLFVATIHMFDESPNIRPMRAEYLLGSGELRSICAAYQILEYAERQPENGHKRRTAQIVARR